MCYIEERNKGVGMNECTDECPNCGALRVENFDPDKSNSRAMKCPKCKTEFCSNCFQDVPVRIYGNGYARCPNQNCGAVMDAIDFLSLPSSP